ncbi:MAG TPA: hypothetical protein VIU61_02135 [Kofleriaceae bacterium]
MTSILRLFSVFSILAACVSDSTELDIDEPVDEADAGKADTVGEYRHYVLWAAPGTESPDARWIARAGGGKLRCPDDEIREACELDIWDFVPTPGLDVSPEVVFDELGERAMIARGRLVRGEDRVHLRASALTRAVTEVTPPSPCFRLRAVDRAGNCPADPDERCVSYALEQLDTTIRELPKTVFFDDVDPTPDSWGQPTPAVQALIDDGLATARTRPVYSCGRMDRRDTGDLYWGHQLFVPRS